MRRVVAIVVVAVLAAACASPALEYARARNPHCRVTPLEDRGDAVRVQIACPDEEPFERTYRSGR
jgi:hypothetical protein